VNEQGTDVTYFFVTMRLPLTIFVDDDVDVKLPPPPAGNPKVDTEVILQRQERTLSDATQFN